MKKLESKSNKLTIYRLNNKNLLLSVLFIGVFSTATYWIGYNTNKSYNNLLKSEWNNIDFILSHLMTHYVDSLDKKELTKKSINNILKDLDPHSTFIPSNKRQSVNESLIGHFGGVGIRFMILRDTLTVVDVIEGGPSFKSGIEKRDRIISVNNISIAGIGINNNDVLKKLKGKVGSNVELGILKTNKNILNITLKRGEIPLKSITAVTTLNNGIGYIKLNSFSNTTDLEFENALKNLVASGIEKLILDLRFNGGGYLHQAINVADEFLPEKKLIVYTDGAHSAKRTFYATKKGKFEKGKLVILVNSGTASASEIVSGAIQDHKRGVIIGRRTFGKGLVQQPVLLPDSSELRITTSRYFTPSGKCIQKPYGDSIDYENDLFERLENGELTFNDTLSKELSKKGGIWPDIFSPIDTLGFNETVSKITFTRNWRNFCFDFYEKHPNKPFDDLRGFFKTFKLEKIILQKYFKENGFSLQLLTKEVIEDLQWSLMLEICSYYYGNQARYILSTYKDNDVKKAIIELNK